MKSGKEYWRKAKGSGEKARVVKSSISIEWLRTVESSKEY